MTTKRAVLYARVSGDDTKNEGRNLAGQLQMCREYAEGNGWSVVAVLAEDDRGASGAELDLPRLNEMLGMARRGEFDILVVREIDRLSRSLPKQLFIEDELKKHAVRVEYVVGDYADTPEGNFMKNVRAAVAELERLKISERAVRGRIQAAKSGSVQVAGKPPYGYDLVKENGKFQLVINEDEARIVRLVFRWYTEGDEDGKPLPLAEITRRLTEMKVPTYTSNPSRRIWPKHKLHLGNWHKATIQKMLQKRAYIGTWIYRKHRKVGGKSIPTTEDEQVQVPVPQIVDEKAWQAAQRRVEWNRRHSKRNRKYHYLLAGHIRCGKCEARCFGRGVQKPNKLHKYYNCGARAFKQSYHHTCDMPYFRCELVDDAVWNWIKELLTEPEKLELGLRQQQTAVRVLMKPLEDQVAIVEEQIDSWQARQERLLDLYLAGKIPVVSWETRNNEMKATLDDLQDQKRAFGIKLDQPGISDQQIQDLKEFARVISEKIDLVDDDFENKRRIIELLDVDVAVNVDDNGAKYLQARCVLDSTSLSIESITTLRTRPTPQMDRP